MTNAFASLVRSAPDGVTNRTLVLPDAFPALNEALWAPDASLAIVVEPTASDMWWGGRLTAVYLDGCPRQVLAPFGYTLRWGP
jgi:hypothetical protein